MDDFESFYSNRRVLVTGHTGFKGSWLCAWLHARGARVFGLSLAPETEPNLYSLLQLEHRIDSTIGDLRDLETVSRCVERAAPEIVFHLGAQALVRPGYRDPVGTYATNVLGTVHLLEACRARLELKAIVVVTSDKCYENREWVWGYRENEALGGHDPYSSSKGCAELVTSAYRRSFYHDRGAAAVASARAGNVIGGGDWAEDRLVADIVRAAVRGDRLTLRYPKATRPWQHVLDPLAGYLLLAKRAAELPRRYSEAYNFGPDDGEPISVQSLAEQLTRRLGVGDIHSTPDDTLKDHEATMLRLDTSLARSRLGWRPLLDFSEAIDWTATWYAEFLKDERAAPSLTERQLEEYSARLHALRPG